MKKAILILGLFVTSAVTTETQALPNWFTEIFGCSWAWNGDPSVSILPNGQCKFSQSMSGHSWLWGGCGTYTYEWVTSCDLPLSGRPPLPEGPSYSQVAGVMGVLKAAGHTEIKSDWCDAEFLEQYPAEFQLAVEYRLELAGYSYQSNWENLVDDPCPVPTPTLTVVEAQAYTYANSCSLSIYPNPSTGNFSIDLTGIYTNVAKIEVISLGGAGIVYSKTAGFSATEAVNISSESDGYYSVVVYTLTGSLSQTIQKSP